MSSTIMPTFKSIARLQLKIQMDSEKASKFGETEQNVRLYEQKKLSFQANDLKFGMVTRIHAFYPRANFQVNRSTTTEDTDGFGATGQNSEQAGKMA